MQEKKPKPPILLPPQPALGALAKKVREAKGEKEPEPKGGTVYVGRKSDEKPKTEGPPDVIWNHDQTKWRRPGANVEWFPASTAPKPKPKPGGSY